MGEVAIVGAGLRLPGANSLGELHEILDGCGCKIRTFSREELLSAGNSPLEIDAAGYVPRSGYLENADEFDPTPFGFSELEAKLLDPQFRKLLECCHEALDMSGQWRASTVPRTAVYASCGMALYAGRKIDNYLSSNLLQDESLLDKLHHLQLMTLNGPDWISTTISFRLGLMGPSVNIQTACSSALVALHMAHKALVNGEIDSAVVGASAIHVPLKKGYRYIEGGIFSKSGHCRPFSELSDGTVGGCGAGAIVLRRLEDALADKQHILAIVKGTATNNDGNRKVAFMAPSVAGQRETLTNALIDAGMNACDIGMVEAHGTGTKIGDPIEFEAFRQVFKQAEGRTIPLESVKGNFGHLDTASGIASLLKVIMALQRKKHYGLVGYTSPNKLLRLQDSPFVINAKTHHWDENDRLRTALISSLGAGGTNAAVVLQEWPTSTAVIAAERPLSLSLSAPSPLQLQEYCERFREKIAQNEADVGAMCEHASRGLRTFDAQVSFIAKTPSELKSQLDHFIIRGSNDSHLPREELPCVKRCEQSVDLIEENESIIAGTPPIKTPHLPRFPWQSKKYWVPSPLERGTEANASVYRLTFEPVNLSTSHSMNVAGHKLTILSSADQMPSEITSALAAWNKGLPTYASRELPERKETSGLYYIDPSRNLPELIEDLTELCKVLDTTNSHFRDVVILTLGAVPIDRERTGSPVYSAWAFLRSMRHELKHIRLILADFGILDDVQAQLPRLINMREDFNEIVWHQGTFHKLQWLPHQNRQLPTAASIFSVEDKILITGAGGGIAQVLVLKLVELGVRRFVLVGRSKILQGLDTILQRPDIELVTHNVEFSQAQENLINPEIDFHDISYIFHLAADLCDSTLYRLSAEQFFRAFMPKVGGLDWIISSLQHSATKLKKLVAFSSIASAFGNAGQAMYSAANACMEQRVFNAAANGLPAVAICWDAWLDIGMTKGMHLTSSKHLISIEEGLNALVRILPEQNPMALVSRRELLPRHSDNPKLHHREPDVRDSALSDPLQRTSELLKIVSSFCGIPVEKIDPSLSFSALGLDSLAIVMIKDKVNETLRTSLSTSDFYSHPTTEAIGEFMARSLLGASNSKTKKRNDFINSRLPLRTRHEPKGSIAIVGVGLRLPHNISDMEELWEALKGKLVPKGTFPLERFWGNGYSDSTFQGIYTREGCFLNDDCDAIDPTFFGISPRVAKALDPQHRLLLNVSWEAIENANLPLQTLRHGRTGIYVGIGTDDYAQIQSRREAELSADTVLGMNRGAAAGRIAFSLGLSGPAITIDTTCSSSLVAVHLAVQELLAGGCDFALAGGVHLILSPDNLRSRCSLGVVSTKNEHRAFDAGADGFVQGEGAAVILLRRLEDALDKGDSILAVIDATSVNHNATSNGLQAPNGDAQADLIRQCIEKAGINPAEVRYVEAHGTGTNLGDPVEFAGIASTYGSVSRSGEPLYVGSIKSNFGHLEPAAGIVSLLKAAVVASKGIIPPQPNFSERNPHIPWSDYEIDIATTSLTLKSAAVPLRVAASSFGISGTNAHVILSSPPPSITGAAIGHGRVIFPVSAQTEPALEQLRETLIGLVRSKPDSIADIAYTLQTGRTAFPYRMIASGNTAEELLQNLAEAKIHNGRAADVAYIFCGQGSQIPGGGRQYYETFEVFRKTIDNCAALWLEVTSKDDFIELFFSTDIGKITETQNAQAIIYAFGWATFELLQLCGIAPTMLVGHSVGDFLSAAAAGVWSFADGFRLIVQRGAIMASAGGESGMLAVRASEQEITSILSSQNWPLDISVVNSSNATVVGGAVASLNLFELELKARNLYFRRVNVSHAFHSRAMAPIQERWDELLSKYHFNKKKIPVFSNITGELSDLDHTTQEYWSNHLRKAVRFDRIIERLSQMSNLVCIEIGELPILSNYLTGNIDRHLIFDQSPGGLEQILTSSYVFGCDVNWDFAQFEGCIIRNKVSLPKHPMRKRKYLFRTPSGE